MWHKAQYSNFVYQICKYSFQILILEVIAIDGALSVINFMIMMVFSK